METSLPDEMGAPGPASRLGTALEAMPSELFAVLDGSYFDDLEEQFAGLKISAQSLFLDGSDKAVRRDGPWLVNLNNPAARDQVVGLAAEKPCAVFWSCDKGQHALWRHLRTINKVMLVDLRYVNSEQAAGKPVKHERVLFRHWDPNALATVLPVLDRVQLAQLFGPAQVILLNATTGGGLKRATRPADLPSPPNSVITLDPAQQNALENRTQAAYCARMGVHLRAMAPEHTAAMTDRELNERILRYEASGNRLGIGQERSLALWGFLMLSTGDRFDSQPEIQSFIRSGPGTPDENVETLMDQMTRLANTFGEVS